MDSGRCWQKLQVCLATRGSSDLPDVLTDLSLASLSFGVSACPPRAGGTGERTTLLAWGWGGLLYPVVQGTKFVESVHNRLLWRRAACRGPFPPKPALSAPAVTCSLPWQGFPWFLWFCNRSPPPREGSRRERGWGRGSLHSGRPAGPAGVSLLLGGWGRVWREWPGREGEPGGHGRARRRPLPPEATGSLPCLLPCLSVFSLPLPFLASLSLGCPLW